MSGTADILDEFGSDEALMRGLEQEIKTTTAGRELLIDGPTGSLRKDPGRVIPAISSYGSVRRDAWSL